MVGVGGVVAGRDHRLEVGADAQVVREVGGWNNHITMGRRLRETRRRDHATSLAQAALYEPSMMSLRRSRQRMYSPSGSVSRTLQPSVFRMHMVCN